VMKLRALWSLYTIGATDEAFLRAQLRHSNEHVRTWGIRLLTDTWPLDTVMSQRPGGKSEVRNPKSATGRRSVCAHVGGIGPPRENDSPACSPRLASTLQRLPVSQRWIWPPLMGEKKTRTITTFLAHLVWIDSCGRCQFCRACNAGR
jgi:hypothetical protein